jgi:phosphomannomutase/phosphomannomutase/phosphoglucomutase
MTQRLACFKAYDIRGRVPEELNEDVAYRLGRAYAAEIRPAGPVAVGRDVRLSSPALAAALIRGLNEGGADTRDIGLCGTEMVYFAAARPGLGGGIMVTASHNPMEYNGLKLVRAGAVPVSGDSGLDALERRVREAGGTASVPVRGCPCPSMPTGAQRGTNTAEDVTAAYVQKLLSFVDVKKLKPFKIVVNAGNGGAGPLVDALAPHLPFTFVRLNHQPDGNFPNGVPNPMIEATHPPTAAAVRREQAAFGIAWDGDFDRCFFFDERGEFVEGYYLVGLLARQMLRSSPGGKIIHDPRLTWNTVEQVRAAGGVPVLCKTGHAFIKERMRAEDAVYGGEMSAHHYFRDFAYCDTGMVPWLVLAQLLSESGKTLSELVAEGRRNYPCSGEINSRVADAPAVIARILELYGPQATARDMTDGISLEFGGAWRFNLRSSQTEPILRLNVEARGDEPLMRAKTAELLSLIRG